MQNFMLTFLNDSLICDSLLSHVLMLGAAADQCVATAQAGRDSSTIVL